MPCYPISNFAPLILDPQQTWIAPSANVIGQVVLQPLTSIWFGAVIRGDNDCIRVGRGTNIQDNAVLHTDAGIETIIGNNCSIGHGAIVHGCRIEDNCLIGMGAIVLNGAIIGKNCLVGAGSLVTEHKIFPENSLIIGAPARIARTLTSEEIISIKRSAEEYQKKAAHFRAIYK